MTDSKKQTLIAMANDPTSWLAVIWEALDEVEMTDAQHDEVATAMAWIAEDYGIEDIEVADYDGKWRTS